MKKYVFLLVLVALCSTTFASFTGGDFYWQDPDGNSRLFTTWMQANVHEPSLGTNAGWLVDLRFDLNEDSDFADSGEAWSKNIFTAFCLESHVSFTPGTTYWATLDTVAFSGDDDQNPYPNYGGGINGDPVSDVTKYIVENYQTLAVTHGGIDKVRDAIWWAEQEIATKNQLAKDVSVILGYGEDVLAVNLATTDEVLVLNSWASFTKKDINGDNVSEWVAKDVQSHILIPAPGALLLGSIGTAFVGWLRRRSS